MGDVPCGLIGELTDSGRIVVADRLDVSLEDAKAAWQGTFA